MKQKREITMKVTPDEEDLIKAIRNYCDSYPNGYPELLDYARTCQSKNNKSSPFGEGP